jgi:acylphosphatase
MPEQLHVVVSGRVQGVGYRQSTYLEATRLGLTGWVRNLPDGRVEAVFEGAHNVQDDMLAWCRKGPTFARVTGVDAAWQDCPQFGTRFEVRY